MKNVTIPSQFLQELLALCGPEDHELRERVLKSAAPAHPAEGVHCSVCGADKAFTGTCGGGRSNPRALCFERAAIAATQSAAQGMDAEYQRGYQDGYNRRDAEVKGALV